MLTSSAEPEGPQQESLAAGDGGVLLADDGAEGVGLGFHCLS
jgi:hypothetical protein